MSRGSTRIVRLPLFQSSASSPLARASALRRLGGECVVERGVAAADHLHPPFEDVADGRLAGLDAEEAGQDRAFDDAADAGDVGDLFSAETTRAVASRGADHLDQRALAHAAADRAVMDVELADRDRNSRRASPSFAAHRGRAARRLGGVVGPFVEPVAQVGEARVEHGQEFLVGQAAPIVAVERLVARGAHSRA